MREPGFRDLALLDGAASSARVLNLRRTALAHPNCPDLQARPFFKSAALNRSIIVKHHLRAHELDAFDGERASATKVMLPIDPDNLRVGAKYFFIGQRDAGAALQREFGLGEEAHPDIALLDVLAELPSFDPFLLRETLRSRGWEPSSRYFEVSEADIAQMLSFARAEIQPLVAIAFPASLGAGDALARSLLSDASPVDLTPLRHVLDLDAAQVAEGVFCWKAFLYYKWKLGGLAPALNAFTLELANVRPGQRGDTAVMAYIASARAKLTAALTLARSSATRTLRLYDQAYNGLIHQGDGRGFRDFLMQAPARFTQLGQELAVLDHMVRFWRFRFGDDARRLAHASELAQIFRDFEAGLRLDGPPPPARRRA